ncbi:Trimethyllysine dioxygenase [Flagelloscypha sp. PMI_526]|nr:Trimethyllysine dioxygenase [Flagelloscypha sp. PMI_526]
MSSLVQRLFYRLPRPVFRRYSTRSASATIDSHTRTISVTSDYGKTINRFHNIWLRDHCRCEKCFHQVTKQRLFDTFAIPRDIAAEKVSSSNEGIEVTWNHDSHNSFFPWSWLKHNAYDSPAVKVEEKTRVLWGSDIAENPPRVEYMNVMASEQGVLNWLENIDKFGFSFVSGVPATPEATEELCEKIGFIRETQYGKFWDFTSDLAKGDTAYTTLALGAHTDPSGLQLFIFCPIQTWMDSMPAALLKEMHPQAYALLSTVTIPAHAAGEASAFYTPTPRRGYSPLSHDSDGNLFQVRWNNDDRSTMNHLRFEQVEEWYDAIRLWNSILQDERVKYWVQIQPGTAVVVDNHRVMHGRSAFHGKRRMCGAYIGIDEYKSRLAVLRRDLQLPESDKSVWSSQF